MRVELLELNILIYYQLVILGISGINFKSGHREPLIKWVGIHHGIRNS